MSVSEFEPKPMSPVRRYYNNVFYMRSHNDAMMALDNLYDTLEFVPVYSFDEVIAEPHLLMPDEDEYADDGRLAKEKMALLPLYILGPSIERSELAIPTIDAWYNDVVSHILMVTRETHDQVCLEFEGGTPAHVSCNISEVCPWRYMETYFGDPAIMPEIDDPFFAGRTKRRHELAMARLAVGQHMNILTQDYALQEAIKYQSSYQLIGTDLQKYNPGA